MQSLWRKTSEFFWQYPILCLPLVVADVFHTVLLWGRGWCNARIVFFFSHEGQSVLGGSPDISYDRLAPVKASIAAGIVSAGFFFLIVGGYVAALFVTSKLVRDALEGRELSLREATEEVAGSSKRKITLLSMKVLAVCAVAMVLGVLFMVYVVDPRPKPAFEVGYVVNVVVLAGVAYLITPWMVTAVSGKGLGKRNLLTTVRRIAACGVIASSLIGWLVMKIVGSFGRELSAAPVWANPVVALLQSLLTVVPYIPVAIAISLAAFDVGETSIQAGDDITVLS
jgi:hypothetical protein